MKVSASSAISRLGLRFGERRQRQEGGERPPLTSDDEANISDFALLIERTIALLALENEALVAGNVTAVSDFYEEKARLLRDLTLKQPVVEPFLTEETPEILVLRGLVRDLAESLGRNGDLLKGMAAASTSILSEVARIRDRHSLDGIYDKSGQKRQGMGHSAGGKVIKNL